MSTSSLSPAHLRVVVASHNPVKLAATREAFATGFPDARLSLSPLAVASGVDEQPVGDAQTRRGAIHRANGARDQMPEADYWVGLEGGIEKIEHTLLAFAWMAIVGPQDRLSLARTVTLVLPPAVRRLVAGGLELGAANDQVFATTDSKRAGGAFGLLTQARHTRTSVYRQALEMALVPFTHPLYRDAP